MSKRRLLLPVLLLLFSGCQTTADKSAPAAFTPADAIVDAPAYRGRDVVWGGTLIATTNEKQHTLLEILSYPVMNGRPQTSQASQGRVQAKVPGFLDPADYAPGRSVVIEGLFTGVRHGYIGGATTTYAVVEARKASLTPKASSYSWPSNVQIGIGVFKRL